MAMNQQLVITSFDKKIDNATQLQTAVIPDPADHEILVRHQFVGINALYDRELYRGAVPYINVQFPQVFGVESVGHILKVGKEVHDLSVNDTVSIVKVGSAYQEYQVIDGSIATRIP